ncbi:hypothetical protein BCR32DRAFT_251827, partial [Anaeromyces robustus]
MKFFKLLFVFAAAAQAKILNFTKYNSEWVKDQDYTLQYSYLEEPPFSKFQIRLYNSIDSKVLKEVSTDEYTKGDSHSVTLSYPDISIGKYRIVASNKDEEISNNFSVKLVLKASPTTTTTLTPSATNNSTTSTDLKGTSVNTENQKEKGNHWRTIAIVVSILVVLLIVAIIGFVLYNCYRKNKRYEEEANTSIWKVPISEKSISIARGVNAYSVPNASITERDLSFSSDIDGFYSYSSQLRGPEYFATHMGYRERQERTKSVNSYSTNITKASNNILDILYPSNEKKEREKSLHEKSELSIDLSPSHSQKSPGQRRKKHSNSTNAGQGVRNVRSKSSSEVRPRSNSFKASAMIARKSRVSLADSEANAILTKKSRSLVENERNAHLITAALLNENAVDITSSNVNNNSSITVPISSTTTLTGGTIAAVKSIPSIKNDKNLNEVTINSETPEYYIKHTKLNKKYLAVCNYKPKLGDEMNVNKNDIVIIREVFTDGWGLGKNMTTDKE